MADLDPSCNFYSLVVKWVKQTNYNMFYWWDLSASWWILSARLCVSCVAMGYAFYTPTVCVTVRLEVWKIDQMSSKLEKN